MLEHPITVSGTTIQQQGHMILNNRNLNIHLTGKYANTCRACQFLHISLPRGHFQYTAYSSSIFYRNTWLVQLHILNRIRIKRRKQSKQMWRIIHRTSIEKYKVLVCCTSSHIISAWSLSYGCDTRQSEYYLHNIRLSKGWRNILQ